MSDWKALTLRQPWASAVAFGLKQYETRSWSTRYRGPLLIAAAAKSLKQIVRECGLDVIAPLCAALEPEVGKFGLGSDGNLPVGCIVAYARLAECLPTSQVVDLAGVMALSEQERAWGNFALGRYGWRLEDVRRLPVPIPWPGSKPPGNRRRLWNVPRELVDLVDAALDVERRTDARPSIVLECPPAAAHPDTCMCNDCTPNPTPPQEVP